MVGHFDDTIARARPVNDWRSRPVAALLRRDSWRRVQKWLYSVSQVRVGWVRRTVRGEARLQAAGKTDVGFGKTSTCRLTGRKG